MRNIPNICKNCVGNIDLTKHDKQIKAKAINEFAEKICEQIEMDNKTGWKTSKDDVEALRVAMLEQL